MLCSSPIAARGPRRRCPSSRRDPHPAPAGSGGSGSAPLVAPLLLPGPSSGAGTPRAPSREPVLLGRGDCGARPGLPLPLLVLVLVLWRRRAPPRGRGGPLAPDAGAPAPHAGWGGAAGPASPGRGRGVPGEAAVSPAPRAVWAAGQAAWVGGGGGQGPSGLWRRARKGAEESQPPSPRRDRDWLERATSLWASFTWSPSRHSSAHPGAHTSPHVHTRAGPARTARTPEWV